MSIIRREKSRIGLYHALQQGADNNDLFLDEEDYQVFVDYLKKLMKEAWLENDTPELDYFRTYAYCVTPKTFRLIVREEKYNVAAIMQAISQLYSRYFSSKYSNYGPIYRRRFYSEPINDDERLDIIMRYLHQEPLRLGLVTDLNDYDYSSWHEYTGAFSELPTLCEMPKFYQDLSKEQRIEQLLKPLPEGMKCLEPPPIRPPKPTDTQVLSTLKLLTPVTTWDDFKGLPREERLKLIKQLLVTGASIRQLEKLTGIGRGTIQLL